MAGIRHVLRKLANSPGGGDLSSLVKNYIKTFVLQNYRNNLNNPDILDDIIDFLISKRYIRNESEIPPHIMTAIQGALQEIKSDPSFIQPKLQKVRLIYPKQIWDWLNQNGGSSMVVPDEFLAPINQRTWNNVFNKWQSKQEMKQWLRQYGKSGKVPVPPEFTSTNTDAVLESIGIPNGAAGLFEQAKQEVAAGGDQGAWEEMPAGISPDELTQAFLDSYPDYAQQLMSEYGGSVDPFALIKDYAFRAEIGGKSKVKSTEGGRTRTFQDQRLNFFWENPEFIPPDIRASMPRMEKEAFPYFYENADELTQILLDLISQQSPEVQEYVSRKLSNKTMIGPGGKKEMRGPAQFAVDEEGATMDVADTRQQSRAPGLESAESEHDANIQMITAVSNAFKQVTGKMRLLANDVAAYMRRKKKQGKSTQRRAAFIDGMVNAAMDEIETAIDPRNRQALQNIEEHIDEMGFNLSKEALQKIKKLGLRINQELQVDLQSIKWSALVSMSSGARIIQEINQSAQEQGQPPLFENLPSMEDFQANPSTLLSRALRSAKPKDREALVKMYPALYSGGGDQISIDPKPNDPSYQSQLAKFYKDETSDFYKRIYVTGELAIDEMGQYLMWLAANGKYSKDLILSFLTLIRTHSGVRQGRYPGTNPNHPSVGVYKGLQSGDFSSATEDSEFLPPTTAASLSLKYDLLKTAISRICDLVDIKKNNIKMAQTGNIDPMINDIMEETMNRLQILSSL